MRANQTSGSKHSTLFRHTSMNRRTLAFAPGLEREFAAVYARRSLAQVRFTLVVGLLFYSGFAGLDLLVAPEVVGSLWWIRFAGFLPLSLVLLGASFLPVFQRIGQALLTAWVVFAGLGIIAMMTIVPGDAGYSYYVGLILVFMVGYTWARIRFTWATAAGWSLVLAYEVAAIWLMDTPAQVLLSNNYFFVGANVLGMLGCYAIERYARMEFLGACKLDDKQRLVERANEALASVNEQLAVANSELERLARYDGLTGIANRRIFDETLAVEWRRMTREKKPIALVLVDVDHFKDFNDTYGHQAGDDCLVQVGRVLAESARRPGDLAARYGGEEFVLLLADTDMDGVCHVATALEAAVDGLRIAHTGSSVADHVTVSMGVVALIPHVGQAPADLVALADAALYEAKEAGRHRFVQARLPDGTPALAKTA